MPFEARKVSENGPASLEDAIGNLHHGAFLHFFFNKKTSTEGAGSLTTSISELEPSHLAVVGLVCSKKKKKKIVLKNANACCI